MVLASPKGEKLAYQIIHELHACTLQYTRLIPDSERTILVLGHVLSCSLSKLHDKTSFSFKQISSVGESNFTSRRLRDMTRAFVFSGFV